MKTATPIRRGARFAAAAAVLALALTACSSGSTPTPSPAPEGGGDNGNSSGELIEVVVGGVPSIDLAPVVLAQEQGFFAEEGLNVTMQPAQTSSTLLPSVINGDVNIGYSAVSATLYAAVQGLPIVTIAPVASSHGEEGDVSGIFVAADSGITTLKELEGKRFGVPGLRSWAEIATREALVLNGVDPDTIDFVEVPFPDMAAALDAGNVDAGELIEPFTTILKAQGMVRLASAFADLAPASGKPLQNTDLVTSEKYLSENADTVAAFVRAYKKGMEYATANPDSARAAIKVLLPQLPDAVVDNLTLPLWIPEIDRSSYERIEALNRKHGGMTGDPVDLDRLLSGAK